MSLNYAITFLEIQTFFIYMNESLFWLNFFLTFCGQMK